MAESSYKPYKMVPMFVIMGTIFFLSHKTGDEISLPGFAYSDLVAHMCAYAALGATVLYAWGAGLKQRSPLKIFVYTVVICLLYGVSDEFHQSFVPGRFVSAMDVAADTLGALLVCTGWWLYRGKSLSYKTVS